MNEPYVVLITNVTSYVGPAAVDRLIADGATIVAQSRDFDEVAVQQAFHRKYPTVKIVGHDERKLVEAALNAYGRLDCVVSNDDARAVRADITGANMDEFRAGLEQMLIRPFSLAQAAIPPMKGQGGGRILLITSAAPLRGLPNYCMYAAARGGANALVLSIARELAPHNILVNAIAPNYVENPTYFPPELLSDPAARAKIIRNIPLGRLGAPEEVGALVSFYAMGDCGFVTGHVVPVAGGWA